MDKNSRIKGGLFIGSVMTLVFTIENLSKHDNLTIRNITISILSGVLWGSFVGLVFARLIVLLAQSKF